MTSDIYTDDKPIWMPDPDGVLNFDQLSRIGGRLIGILRDQPWARQDSYVQWSEVKKIVDLTKMFWHHFQQTRNAHAARDITDHKKLLERMADLLAKVYAVHNCIINSSHQAIQRDAIDHSREMIQQMAVVVKLELDRVTKRMEEIMREHQINRGPESRVKAAGALSELPWEENPAHAGMTHWGERTTADYHTHWCFQRRQDEDQDENEADVRTPTPVVDAGEAMELDTENGEKSSAQPTPEAKPIMQKEKDDAQNTV